jgi:hypothetical protein
MALFGPWQDLSSSLAEVVFFVVSSLWRGGMLIVIIANLE